MSETQNPLRQFITSAATTTSVTRNPFDVDLTEQEILQNLLESLTMTELRKIAKRRVWTVRGTRKDAVVKQLAEQMFASRSDATFLNELSKNERLLLTATHTLFNLNTTLYLEQFQHVWQTVLGKSGSAKRYVNGFVGFGLLYEVEDAYGDGEIYRPFLSFPETVLPVMPLLPREKAAVSPTPRPIFPATPLLNQIERVVHFLLAGGQLSPTKMAGSLDRDAENSYVGNWPFLPEETEKLPEFSPFHFFTSPPELTVPLSPHIVNEATFRTLIDVVNSWDTLDFIVQMMLTVGLLQRNERRQFVIDGELWQAYQALSETEQSQLWWLLWRQRLGDLYELRLLIRETSDLSMWRVAHPDLPFETLIGETIFARQTILRLLRGLAEDQARQEDWHSYPRFLNELLRFRSDLFNDLTGGGAWGFKIRGMKLDNDQPDNWLVTVGQMIQLMFIGPLYWMNIVELAMERGLLHAFRLTPNGRFLLSPFVDEPVSSSEGANGRFEWLDDHTFQLLPGRNTNALMGIVSRLGQSVPNEVRTYRLSEAKLVEAFNNGDTPTLLAEQFAQAGFALPPEALAFLEEVYGRFGHVHLYDSLTLIEFGDDAALVELRAAGLLTDEAIIYQFSPRLVVIQDDLVDELMSKLTERGYTPKQTEAVQ